jgi:copper chaperone
MEQKTVKVPSIGCDGCNCTFKNEVSQLGGVVSVEGDPQTQMVTIQWKQPASWANIRSKMAEIDYAPEA